MRQVEPPSKKAAPAAEDEEDDDIDLFGSDEEEDKEAIRLREERLRQYAEKKAKKPALVAKSSILLDVKPVSGPPHPCTGFRLEEEDGCRAGADGTIPRALLRTVLCCMGGLPWCCRLLTQSLLPLVP